MAVHVEDQAARNTPTGKALSLRANYGRRQHDEWVQDRGTYDCLGTSPRGPLERGDFKFRLHGRSCVATLPVVRTKRGRNDWLA